ncbi:MAG: RimK family alpha-L-glutamate ligase [Candidatus Aenigmarchaeota archaeon]|nr:RimK family alpha-L-glutamate ligase [Candidatus Aenigmarchaeota archaeon]
MIKKSLLIIGAKNAGITTKTIIKEAEKVFYKVKYVPLNDIVLKINEKSSEMFYKKENLSNYDYCLPRIDAARAQHGYHVIKFMDIKGMKKPYSAETVLIAHNKFMSLDVLKRAGVPVPETYLVSSIESAKLLLKKMKYPVIIKIVSGFGGRGVMLLENLEAAISVVETLKLMRQQLIIEEYVKNKNEDKRAYVIGGRVVAGYRRKCKKDEFRSNILAGGTAEYITLSEELQDIAIKAASAIDSDIVAVDMLESKDGPKVIEVNINPGLKGIQPFVNVAKLIVEYMASKVEE